MSLTRIPSGFVIPPPEVVEIATRNVSDFARVAPGESKGKITMIEHLPCYRVPEIAPKHTTRRASPRAHASVAKDRPVRRRRRQDRVSMVLWTSKCDASERGPLRALVS